MNSTEETSLIHRLNQPEHQRQAFEQLVNLYSPQLYRQIRRMVYSHDDTNDILQNTFIKAWVNLDTFRGDARLSTWLYRIATNETLNFLQRKKDMTGLDDAPTAIVNQLTADEYFDTWKNDFSAMLTAVMTTPSTGSLKEYIDIESVVNFFMVNSLSSNHEMRHPKSFKLYKDSLDGVYKFGPVWDFDWAFTFDGREGAPANTPMVDNNGDCGGYTFIKALLSNEEIRTLYQQKWNAFVKDGYPELKAYMEEYATLIEPSAKENGVLWPADYSVDWRLSESSFDFRENFDKLKAWIQQRINYCNEDPNFGLYR